jgi:hypothetical protein
VNLMLRQSLAGREVEQDRARRIAKPRFVGRDRPHMPVVQLVSHRARREGFRNRPEHERCDRRPTAPDLLRRGELGWRPWSKRRSHVGELVGDSISRGGASS